MAVATKKAAAKKTPAKKAPAKKAPAKKAPAKSAAKTTEPAKKAPAKKASNKGTPLPEVTTVELKLNNKESNNLERSARLMKLSVNDFIRHTLFHAAPRDNS